MARRLRKSAKPRPSDIDAALAAMDADELRDVVRRLLLELDDRAHGRDVGRLIERVARGASEWPPNGPSDAVVSKIVAFAEAAERAGYADPMERVAVEPLPGLADFLRRWRARLESSVDVERQNDWDTESDRWLREVVQRTEGADGLAQLARSTKRADDLRAWCRALVRTKDWKAALRAHDEAATIVADKEYARGDFLDGAALAAQALSRRDLPARLERAWREAPSMLRLGRWLGSARSKRTLRKRATHALAACPKSARRQRAFLHVLLGQHESAAKLLSAAPGLGWSDKEHPGHLLVPLFRAVLGGGSIAALQEPAHLRIRALDLDELDWISADRDEPRLATPTVEEILDLAGFGEPPTPSARKAMLRAMRRAAKKRLTGVTENKRRRYYGHAAELVAICEALDPTPNTHRWVSGIRAEYRRYPALQRELAHYVGPR